MKNIKNYTYYLIYLIIGISLSSCFVAQPVLRLSPAESDTRWLMGKEFSTKSTESGVVTAIAFEELQNNYIVIDVEISNLSDDTLLVDPADIYCTFLADTSGFYNSNLENQTLKIFALNPEKKLLDIDKAKSRAIANQKNATAFVITAAVAVIATSAIISSKNKNKSNNNTRSNEVNNYQRQRRSYNSGYYCPLIYVDRDNETLQTTSQIPQNGFVSSNLDFQKENWEFKALRKTHVYPNDRIRGKLVFPASQKDSYLAFLFPYPSQNVKFLFKQKLHSATSY